MNPYERQIIVIATIVFLLPAHELKKAAGMTEITSS